MAMQLLGGIGYYTIDVAVAVLAFVFSLVGARRGAICSVIGLCSTLISLVAAYSLAVPVSRLFDSWFDAYSKGGTFLWTVVGGLSVFLLAKISLSFIAKFLTRIARAIKVVGAANTMLGAIIGFLKAAILICAVLAVLSVLPEWSFVVEANAAIDGTFFTRVIRAHNPLLSWLKNIVENATAFSAIVAI